MYPLSGTVVKLLGHDPKSAYVSYGNVWDASCFLCAQARAFQQGLALNPTDRTLRQGFWDSMNLLSQSRTNSGELVHQAGLVSSATSPSALVNDEQRRARSRLQVWHPPSNPP